MEQEVCEFVGGPCCGCVMQLPKDLMFLPAIAPTPFGMAVRVDGYTKEVDPEYPVRHLYVRKFNTNKLYYKYPIIFFKDHTYRRYE